MRNSNITRYINLKGISASRSVGDGKVYPCMIYDNQLDRTNEMASNEFLYQLAEKIQGRPVIKNHNWDDVDGVVGEVLSAKVTDGDIKYVVADILIKDDGAIEKIEKGLWKYLSVGFFCQKSYTDDGVGILEECTDAIELSFVVCPAIADAGLLKLNAFNVKGDAQMERLKLKSVLTNLASLGIKNLTAEQEKQLAETLDVEYEDTVKDVDALVKKVAELEAENARLANELAGIKAEAEKEAIKEQIMQAVEVEVDALNIEDNVKEAIMDEAEEAESNGDLSMEDTECKGITEFIDKVKTKYTKLGLIGTKSVEKTKVNETVIPTIKCENKQVFKDLNFKAEVKSVNTINSAVGTQKFRTDYKE